MPAAPFGKVFRFVPLCSAPIRAVPRRSASFCTALDRCWRICVNVSIVVVVVVVAATAVVVVDSIVVVVAYFFSLYILL